MGDVIAFGRQTDPEDMSREELEELLARLRREIMALDEAEPEDMDSEEYETWGEAHEELEDRVDEILDLLDELG